jgi:NAD(P)-dependent dehydrogenase (short-subunit alcohol dehydrogenase family)
MQEMNALIIGASGGIGLGFIKKLLLDEKIEKIYASYHRQASATELFNLASLYPLKIICLPMDVTDEDQIVRVVSHLQAEKIGKLHLVINCVGILHQGEVQPEKSLRDINSENLLHYFQVNSIASLLLAKHLLPLLRHQERSIFAVLSAKVGSIGDNALGGWYGYRASKAALNMFMKNVALEYQRKAPENIVVLLHPGTTATNLSQPFQKNVPAEKLFSVERTVDQLLKVIENLELEDSGEFFSWDGTRLPW